jgi:hypothetical protein
LLTTLRTISSWSPPSTSPTTSIRDSSSGFPTSATHTSKTHEGGTDPSQHPRKQEKKGCVMGLNVPWGRGSRVSVLQGCFSAPLSLGKYMHHPVIIIGGPLPAASEKALPPAATTHRAQWPRVPASRACQRRSAEGCGTRSPPARHTHTRTKASALPYHKAEKH